ncbi:MULTISPECIES: hypothetical protein [Paracoccus]|jgi:hypothetical protein|uniref:Uncharacterized protein n=1 Tax=Paracoccus litorisediminis TaxID=2006130 RepID=A0A844HRH9_9RHOB|nr:MULTISPECIES: hypothetical protein [Paracoccus]MBD9528498.1 hypothetical protein [Paracoccus sp. PAR01]MTH60785.1 hypothetical protein [Paracoccus litorisediminis]
MQLDSETRSDLLETIKAAAASLTDLDTALHSMDLVNLQGKVAALMASEIVLLRQIAARFYGVELPDDPVRISEEIGNIPA